MGRETTARRINPLPEGIEIREGKRGSKLRITFYWKGERCRETLKIPAVPSNIKYAERFRGEVINAIERGTFNYETFFPDSRRAKASSKLTKRHKLVDLVEHHIDTGRKTGSMSPSSVLTYSKWFTARIKPKFAETFVDELGTQELRQWIVELSTTLSPKSVRNCVGLVSSGIQLAIDDGIIHSNPLSPIKLRKLLPKKRLGEDDDVDPFNSDEISAILNSCRRVTDRAFFQFAFATGLRTGELIALKWRHIDFTTGVIRVSESVVDGEKGAVEKTTKTENTRDVPLLPAAKQALDIMRPMTAMLNNGDYVFTFDGKSRWRDSQQVRARWTSAVKLAKIRYRNQYQTRHTFASTLLMNGEPEIVVATLLGHSSVEMVRRHYGKFIKQPGGIRLKSDYQEFGANLGQLSPLKSA